MNGVRWTGRVLVLVASLCVVAAWIRVWIAHQEDVNRARFAMGPDAKVPAFDPEKLVNPDIMPMYTLDWYVLALATGIPGLICIVMTWRRAHKQKDAV